MDVIDKIVIQQTPPTVNAAWMRKNDNGEFDFLVFYRGGWRKINNAVDNK